MPAPIQQPQSEACINLVQMLILGAFYPCPARGIFTDSMQTITTMSGRLSEFPSGLATAMARYRHQIFIERLGWPLTTHHGAERDQFDRPDTLYVLALDAEGKLCGCARLLPTSRPYLLGVIFPQMAEEQPLPCSSTIWEISRFACTSASATHSLLAATVARAAAEGAIRLMTISPIGVERLLQRMKVRTQRAGKPVHSEGKTIVACWIEIDAQTRAALGIAGHEPAQIQAQEDYIGQ